MKVKLYGMFEQEQTEEEQTEFLSDLKETFCGFKLPVQKISSERKTGGPVILEVPDLELPDITRALASFAEVFARQTGQDISFPFEVVELGFKATAAGAI